MKVKLGISLILAVLIFFLVYQNTAVVKVTFLAWSLQMSLVLLVLIVLGAGMVSGWLLNSYLRFARSRKRTREQALQQTYNQGKQDMTQALKPGENSVDE